MVFFWEGEGVNCVIFLYNGIFRSQSGGRLNLESDV